MQTEYKVENNTLKIVTTNTTTTVNEVDYDLDMLNAQLEALNTRRAVEMATYDAEETVINERISKCREYGLKTKAEIDAEQVQLDPTPQDTPVDTQE